MSTVEFWWQSPPLGSDRYFMAGAWYWRDDYCDEPMGPFESRAEAAADYRELRDAEQRLAYETEQSPERGHFPHDA